MAFVTVRAPVVDAFRFNRGAIQATIDENFLNDLCNNMNRRHQATGDVCPIVVGHTPDPADGYVPEKDLPPKVGHLENFGVEQFNGQPTAFADYHFDPESTIVINGAPIKLSADEIMRRWPRRSAELWLGRREVHPISLLGATAPERDLGLLKLSSGSETGLSLQPPGQLMPTPAVTPENAGELPVVATLTDSVNKVTQILDQIPIIQQLITQLQEVLSQAQSLASEPAPGNDLSPEALDEILGGLGQGGQPQGAAPALAPEPAKLSREQDLEAQLKAEKAAKDALQANLDRNEIQVKLGRLRTEEGCDIDPTDGQLVTDLLALPPDIRQRSIDRLKLSRKLPGFGAPNLGGVVAQAPDVSPGGRMTEADKARVVSHSLAKGIKFETAAVQLGFTLS